MCSAATKPLESLIRDHITDLQQDIPPSVTLMAVSKKKSASCVRAAYDCGLRHFGESRIQEAVPKQKEVADLSNLVWHFIGTLQSNKAKKAITHFHWIHSVDSLKLAQRLDRLSQEENRRPNLCLQVKVLPDPHKSGWNIDELMAALPELYQLSHVAIRGLMVIPPLGLSPEETHQCFAKAADLFTAIQCNSSNYWSQFDQLSMGMSGDYQEAIAAGSTMIRLGRTIFGERDQ
ncbi:MAG: YggS family pyridoxal phosphate-dependent enzyme [Cyanobacteria bacterium P01_F01_bin.153]